MKPICPRCSYTGIVEAATAPGATCPRCGEPLNQLLRSGAQASTLLTAAIAPAFTPQSIMQNQNAYAPSAEAVFEDVLEIPTPPRSNAQPTGEQMLVLEDVIPEEDFSSPEEMPGLPFESTDTEDDTLLEEDTLLRAEPAGYILSAETAAPAVEMSTQVGPQVYGASETSSFDYDHGRAWLRIVPLLLLLGTLVFFALYFLGNRMGNWGSKPQELAAANPAPPETQSPAPAVAPEKAEPASSAPQTAAADSTAPAAKEDTPAPAAKPSEPEAKPEPKPAASAQAPVAAPATAPAAAPSAQQAVGNFTVQVGSYNNSAQADERAGRLRSGGIEARVVRAEIPHRGTWYRVQAGQFASRDEAARFASELKGKGAADSFLITELQGQ
jgi:cell division septation protein DedD